MLTFGVVADTMYVTNCKEGKARCNYCKLRLNVNKIALVNKNIQLVLYGTENSVTRHKWKLGIMSCKYVLTRDALD